MDLRSLSAHPAVEHARTHIRALRTDTLHQQTRLSQIPSPSFAEQQRARAVQESLEELGLADVRRDEVGNVVGALSPGSGDASAPPVLLSAHLDTVFPQGTDTTVRQEGDRWYGPGITDNARGLAALLTVCRTIRETGLRTRLPVVVAATVGEEGKGDLRGVKWLFREESPLRRASAFVALDGAGTRRVVHRAIGSHRLRFEVHGPGGHSWGDWGAPNPLHAIGRLVAAVAELDVPRVPRTTATVARTAGGTSINALPAEAWAELDLRSEDPGALSTLVERVRAIAREAVGSENRGRRATAAVRLEEETIGSRPAGTVSVTETVVRAAMEATELVGARPELVASSTDANFPISLGIPSVTLGAGGSSGGVHTLGEWYRDDDGARGLERALLTLLGTAGLAEE